MIRFNIPDKESHDRFSCSKHVQIQMANVTRLCTTKALLTVNGQYPGPAIVAREGDRVVVNVTNNVQNNVSIHWYRFCSLIHLIISRCTL